MLSSFLSFLPHLIIGLGSVAVVVYSVIEKDGAETFRERILSFPKCLEFFGGILGVIGAVWLAIQQVDFENDLISMITGGDGFCYMQFENYKNADNVVDLLFKCDGDYPIFDVDVRVDNVQKIAAARERVLKLQPKSIMEAAELIGKDSFVKRMGNIVQKSASIFGRLELSESDYQAYNITRVLPSE